MKQLRMRRALSLIWRWISINPIQTTVQQFYHIKSEQEWADHVGAGVPLINHGKESEPQVDPSSSSPPPQHHGTSLLELSLGMAPLGS
jgi:hypothetical protein